MLSNKDKGTSVGFSKGLKDYVLMEFAEELGLNNVCKEHEWMIEIPSGIVYCKNCALRQVTPINFEIEENFEVINKQEWQDIWNEFKKGNSYKYTTAKGLFQAYVMWLEENFVAPKKKNV